MSVVIRVEDVCKVYRLGVVGYGTLRQDLQSWWARTRGGEDPNAPLDAPPKHADSDANILHALSNICFDVSKGESLGIIGRNGAGKSTLLQIIAGMTIPTSGRVKIRGKVASLLSVGAGFHPDLTGRENIYLKAATLGMSRAEVSKKYEEIVEFSEIGRFIDTPMKRYSKGMNTRLGFAVAAHLEPEVLLVDEVLTGGDHKFRLKVIERLKALSAQGCTVLFVSHKLGALRQLCSRAIRLDQGRMVEDGATDTVINNYFAALALPGSDLSEDGDPEDFRGAAGNGDDAYERNKRTITAGKAASAETTDDVRKPGEPETNGPARILGGFASDGQGNKKTTFSYAEDITFTAVIEVQRRDLGLASVLAVVDENDNRVLASYDNDLADSQLAAAEPGIYNYRVTLGSRLLKPGLYQVNFAIRDGNSKILQKRKALCAFELVDNETRRGLQGNYDKGAIVAPELHWELDHRS